MKQLRANLISKPITALAAGALSFLLGAQAVFAQGVVNFSNNGTFLTEADRRVFDPMTCAPLVGTDWVAALYFGTTPDAITELAVRGLEDISLLRAIGRFRAVEADHPLAGTWVGGIRVLPATTVGQLLFMQVRVWDISLFATFDDAKTMGGFALVSAPFSYRSSFASDPTNTKMNNFVGITPPECISEPPVFALTALGIGVLLAWRCKNQR